MENIHIKALQDIGLNSRQAKVYLALMELGEGTVQQIAEASGVKRTTIYALLDELKSLGFVYKTNVRTHTLYIAERPMNLQRKFESKVVAFSEHANILEEHYAKSIHKPRVMFFDGAEGFRKIWKVVLSSGVQEYLIIIDPAQMLAFVQKGYIKNSIIKEKVRLGIKSRHIVAASEYTKEIVSQDKKENRISKMLPHTYKLPVTTIIFGDNVALIGPAIENTMLIIESEAYAKSQRSIFEALWDKLPSIEDI